MIKRPRPTPPVTRSTRTLVPAELRAIRGGGGDTTKTPFNRSDLDAATDDWLDRV